MSRGATWAKPSKYRNVKTEVAGIVFDSKREAKRWTELLWLEKTGVISALERQRSFTLTVAGHKICRYVADFVYLENGKQIVEDSKGAQTPVFKLKAKLFRALFPDLELRLS